MANNTVKAKESKAVVEPIKLRDDVGNIYVLEFNRATVKFAEERGFKVNGIDEGAIITTAEQLFYYSFRMHQPKITKAETDRFLYEKLKGMPEGMLDRLVDLYLEPVFSLAQKEDDAKNATMTAEF